MRGLGSALLIIGILVFLLASILWYEDVGSYDANHAYYYMQLFAQVFVWSGIALFAGGGARSTQPGARMPGYYQQTPMGQPMQMGQPMPMGQPPAPWGGAGATTPAAPAATQQPTGPAGVSTSSQCSSCGAPLASGAAFCSNCGTKL